MPTGAENAFLTHLNALHNDASACCRYYYTLATIDAHAVDHRLRAYLNDHADFWNTVQSALQASAVIALGRTYDKKREVNNADKCLAWAEKHSGIFSKDALKSRKLDVLGETEAEQYVQDAFEPRQTGFKPLREALTDMQTLYQEKVQPIRHNVFAHAGQLTPEERDELFADLGVRDFERLIVFPLQLWDALYGLYHNGQKTDLRDAPTVISEVIDAGAPDTVSTWDHIHAASSTKQFVESLEPLLEELYRPRA